jgi:D-alanyl-D-alanine carboxypeptidase
MHLRSLLLLTLLPACAGTPALPPTSPTSVAIKDLGPLLEPLREEAGLPALGAAIVEGQGLRALGVTGFRQRGGADKVTTQNPWHLGSDTKAMTATLVAVLVKEGVIRWETQVHEVWPQAHKGWEGVTLEALLVHRGGATRTLAGDRPDLWAALWQEPDGRVGRTALVAALVATAPNATVGSFTYSNAGYIIAGAMLEARTDLAWEDLLRSRIFATLGMESCGFGAPGGKAPWGHRAKDGSLQAIEPGLMADNPSGLGPAGTVHCSLADWGRFLQAHLRRGTGAGPLVSNEAFVRMHTPHGNYAHGWIVIEQAWAGGRALIHSGSNTMWFATALLAPERDRGYLVVTNSGQKGAAQSLNRVIGKLIKLDSEKARGTE